MLLNSEVIDIIVKYVGPDFKCTAHLEDGGYKLRVSVFDASGENRLLEPLVFDTEELREEATLIEYLDNVIGDALAKL